MLGISYYAIDGLRVEHKGSIANRHRLFDDKCRTNERHAQVTAELLPAERHMPHMENEAPLIVIAKQLRGHYQLS